MGTFTQANRIQTHPPIPFRAAAPLALAASTLVSLLGGTRASAQQATGEAFHYPATRRSSQVDVYHGTRVEDPYRWLEDTDSPETRAWIEAQNELTFAYLATIPEREQIRQRLTELWNYPKYGVPFKRKGRYFYFQNSGLQNQSVLYVQEGLDGAPRVLLDPNTLSTDGTVALSTIGVSDNGRWLGYGISRSGSDWQEFRVRDVSTERDLPDVLKWVKFSGLAWTKDNKGFFYSRYDEPKDTNAMLAVNRNQKLYYHRLGTPQEKDELIFDSPEHPDWGVTAEVSDDGQFAVLTISQGTDTRNRLYFIDLDTPGKPKVTNPVVRLFDDFDASYEFIDNVGTMFYVRTDQAAPRGRVIAVNIEQPARASWRSVIPQGEDALASVDIVGGRFVAHYLKDAHSVVRFFGPTGDAMGELSLPGLGTVGGLGGRRDDRELFYSFTSFLRPPTVFRHDFKKGTSATFREPKLAFDAAPYETRQVFYTSKDGTRVPMFITAKKGVKLDGNNPTLLYGYGGFDISLTPSFSASRLVWLEMGGIYAVANIRGGGEYGKAWHEEGTKARKQNVFDDFIAAAEYLQKSGYTSPKKLAIQGGSNGGLLVGAVMTQRPELFGVALPAVGVMDMLRFHKFTIGWAWVSDYGSSDDSTQFEVLRKYSPLHNLKPGTHYPATLATTADHDDRVVPGHSFKFAAALQAAQGGPAPVMIRIDTKAGHGAGKPTTKVIDQAADEMAFAVKNLGMSGATP
ncbi:MAG TPA: prolyl oligopeptidase family serine peptidase [Gemmatimonadaceae bacterium]|nr:prolyl oligopeptidase family serine peptidase [Gemmatimonadaceae bacterium]